VAQRARCSWTGAVQCQAHLSRHANAWAADAAPTDCAASPAKFGCSSETLRGWVRKEARNRGWGSGTSMQEHDRLKELERENRGLRQVNEMLRKASAYFAQAELDRRPK
ncbi:transposase, partial [Pandoraea sputorum]|uniref:transposase n=1 Tax=Pandoraea sputorum TaxID=93222 RepID=UPI0037C52D5A